MKIDAIMTAGLDGVAAAATAAEHQGFDGLMLPEVAHDPFLPAPLAAASTSSFEASPDGSFLSRAQTATLSSSAAAIIGFMREL